MRIGAISDTHGLMRPQALDALRNSDLILHAGDVGKPEILAALQKIAPVRAIRGNVDHGAWADVLPVTANIQLPGLRIFMLHDRNILDFDPATAGFHLVISGHTHKASRTTKDNVTYLNPGSAGPRRFRLPVTVAQIEVEAHSVQISIVELAI